MKKAIILVVSSVLVVGLASCGPSLSESFDDVQENAPSFCKDWCSDAIECTWDDQDYEGESADEDGLFDLEVKDCVVNCAFPTAEGAYVIDEKDDGDQEIVGKISGSLFQDVADCIFALELWKCEEDSNNNHFFFLDYDDNDDDCENLQACYEQLDISYSCDWNDSANFCDCSGEEKVPGLTV